MEAFSWAFHKFIMHGPLWFIHKTHHLPSKSALEANDVFSLFFGSIAASFIFFGLRANTIWLAGLGFGITTYGLVYFVLHDMGVHNRIKNNYLSRATFFSRIKRAHKIHHKSFERIPSSSFGLLVVAPSVFQSGANDRPNSSSTHSTPNAQV
jgi:beta-carotene 3-hydroxylase